MQAIVRKRTPAMVGIDPRWSSLPSSITDQVPGQPTAEQVAKGFHQFGQAILEATADLLAVVKFQSAFFEAAGPAGVQVLWSLAQMATRMGMLVIMDAKRGDIGSTAEAYAEAYLSPVPGEPRPVADALTVNPFLGRETVDPFVKSASKHHGGVFVLVRTSNPGSADLQLQSSGGETVSDRIASWVEEWAKRSNGPLGFGSVGAVVGATHPAELLTFRKSMPHAILLLPGYGAQGGAAKDLADAFDSRGLGGIVNNSRGIIFAYQSEKRTSTDWPDAIRSATREMIADLADHTPAGNL
jgi:orotidine-5'-phosphate decarboxylase